MTNYETYFERLELKFLISESLVPAIRRAIAPYCPPDRHNPGPEAGYVIYTLYLDGPSLPFHRAKMRSDPVRYKLRIRTYESGPAFLEVKHKVNRIIYKRRFAVAEEHIRDAAYGVGGPVLAGRQTDVDHFAHLMALHNLEPVVHIRYEREAYVSTVDDYARVTFDRRLAYEPMTEWNHRGDDRAKIPLDTFSVFDGVQSPVILELKCETRVPLWLSFIIREFQLRRLGFSKYSTSVLTQGRIARGLGARTYV